MVTSAQMDQVEAHLQEQLGAATGAAGQTQAPAMLGFSFGDDDESDDNGTVVAVDGPPPSDTQHSHSSACEYDELAYMLQRNLDAIQTEQKASKKDKQCPLPNCETVITGNQRFCRAHFRYYEPLRRRCLRDVDDNNPDTETENSINFKTIFGHKTPKGKAKGKAKAKAKSQPEAKHQFTLEGDPERQETCLNDLMAKHPEYGDADDPTKSKSTKAKFENVSLSQYVELRGTTKASIDAKRRPRWDKALFDTKVKKSRPNWQQARLDEEWAKILVATPDIEKRWEGDREAPLQLPVPGWICGKDSADDTTTNFHTREMETKGGAATAMEAEQLAKAITDCAIGFGSDGVRAAHASDTFQEVGKDSVTYSNKLTEKGH